MAIAAGDAEVASQACRKSLVGYAGDVAEARQALLNNPRIRFGEKGHTPGQDVYAAFGMCQ